MYIEETSKNINKGLYDHKRDILRNNTNNAFVFYHNRSYHNFDINNAVLII